MKIYLSNGYLLEPPKYLTPEKHSDTQILQSVFAEEIRVSGTGHVLRVRGPVVLGQIRKANQNYYISLENNNEVYLFQDFLFHRFTKESRKALKSLRPHV